MPKELLSIVVPVHNEEKSLGELKENLIRVLDGGGFDFEVIFINDGSQDRSLEIITQIHRQDPRFKLISFTRNFGHEVATTAGLDFAQGDAVVIMDADLQDPPELIPQMLSKWKEEGYEIVFARRESRKGETWLKKVSAFIFYRFMEHVLKAPIPKDAGDFRLIDKRVALSLRNIRERNRFMRGLVTWTGYRMTSIPFERNPRKFGRTKYNFPKLFKLAWDSITAFSTLPLQIITFAGMLISFLSFSAIIAILVIRFVFHHAVEGWASLMVSVFFLGGIQIFILGVIGEYLGRIYVESQQRPLYIIDKTLGLEQD